MSKENTTLFVGSNEQLADNLTKSLRGPRIAYICDKLDAYNLYAPAWGGMLKYYEVYKDIPRDMIQIWFSWFCSYLYQI